MGLLLIYFLNPDLNVIRTKKTTFAQNSIMAETLHLIQGSREEKYKTLVPQLRALIADETDLVANCANIAAALRQTFGFFWWRTIDDSIDWSQDSRLPPPCH